MTPSAHRSNLNEDGITQVLLNLFYNAIEATGTEGNINNPDRYTYPKTRVVHIRVQDDGTWNSV